MHRYVTSQHSRPFNVTRNLNIKSLPYGFEDLETNVFSNNQVFGGGFLQTLELVKISERDDIPSSS